MDSETYPFELVIRFAYLAVAMNKSGTKIWNSDKIFLLKAMEREDFAEKTELIEAMREI